MNLRLRTCNHAGESNNWTSSIAEVKRVTSRTGAAAISSGPRDANHAASTVADSRNRGGEFNEQRLTHACGRRLIG